jgi:hypothetical protein
MCERETVAGLCGFPAATAKPRQLIEAADRARAEGDHVKARNLVNQAIALDLGDATNQVRAAQVALDEARLTQRMLMEDARDRGWGHSRIGRVVGASAQRVAQILGKQS